MSDPTKSMTADELIELAVSCYEEAVSYRYKAKRDRDDLHSGDLAAAVAQYPRQFAAACTESAERAEQQALAWIAQLKQLAEDTHPNAFVDFGVDLAIALASCADRCMFCMKPIWRAILARHCSIVLTL